MAITENHPKWQYYSQLRQCGEITASLDGRHFGLNCGHCRTIFPWINIKDFLRHLHYAHKSALFSLDQQRERKRNQRRHEQTNVKKRKKPRAPLAAASDVVTHSNAACKRPKQNTKASCADDTLCVESDNPLEEANNNLCDVSELQNSDEPCYSEDTRETVSEIVIEPVIFKQIIKEEVSDWNFSSDGEATQRNSQSTAEDESDFPRIKLDLLSLENQEVLSYIIEVYQKNAMLWDKEHTCYSIFAKKVKLFNEMTKEIQSRFKLRLHYTDISSAFTGLRKLYVEELLNRKQKKMSNNKKSKTKDPPKLWCFDKLDFLREQELAENCMVEITTADLAQVAEIYEHYSLLWNPDSDESHSRVRQVETQREMLQEVNARLKLNMTLNQLRTRIARLRSFYVADKRKRLNCAENDEEFQPDQPLFYEKLRFLERYIGPFRCKQCAAEITKYPHFKAHLAAHEGRLPYTCPICKKDFKYFNNFVVHKRRHNGEKPFVCDVCDVGFAAATDLRTHASMHTGEKTHMCHICGAAFRTTALLRNHRIRHDPNRPRFRCTICLSVMLNKGSFNQHMETHRMERTEVCPVCDKTFLRANTLRQHMQLHDTVKKYQCKYCVERFAQRAGLFSHVRRYHS